MRVVPRRCSTALWSLFFSPSGHREILIPDNVEKCHDDQYIKGVVEVRTWPAVWFIRTGIFVVWELPSSNTAEGRGNCLHEYYFSPSI